MTKKQRQLAKARRVRSSITDETRALKNDRITLQSVLEDPESFSLGRCRVFDVLRRAPHLGEKGAKKVLLEAKVWPLDRLRDVPLFDREEILKCLPPRAR